jgi:MFS family permease
MSKRQEQSKKLTNLLQMRFNDSIPHLVMNRDNARSPWMPPPIGHTMISSVNFFWACVSTFLVLSSYYSTFFLAPFVESLGGTPGQGGALYSSLIFTYLVSAPLTGVWCDTRRAKLPMLVGSAILGLGTISFSSFTSWHESLYVIRIAQGIGMGMFMTSAFVYVANVVPEGRRGALMGIYTALITLASAIVTWLGEVALETKSFQWLFSVAGIVGLLGSGVILLAREPERSLDASRDRLSLRKAFRFIKMYRVPQLRALMAGVFAIGICYGVLNTFATSYARTIHLPSQIFFLAVAAITILSRVFIMPATDRIYRDVFVGPSFAILAIAFLGFAVQTDGATRTSYGLASALYAAGYGVVYPLLSALVVDRTDAAERGTALAAFNIAFMSGVHCMNSVFGHIAQTYGYTTYHVLLACVAIIGYIIYWLLDRKSITVARPVA